jgi:predicted metalloprotease with PDZ domain
MSRSDEPRTVRYAISVERPTEHVVKVKATYGALREGPLDLVLPVWSPGSYKVRDYSKHVQDLVARDERGRRLEVRKTRKNAWRIERGDARSVTVEHGVYSFEFSVRTNHVDDRHAFICGTNTFLYVEGELDRPAILEVDPPEGWDVACSLDREPLTGTKRVFWAKDYDTLVDAPVEMGPFERLAFEHKSVVHEVVVSGGGNRPAKQWVEDLKKIVATEVALWGELPCPRYLFIVHLFARGQGGLEHENSTAIQFPRAKLKKKKDYERFLSLLAHEYFHLWNGKRIRPLPLGPFDYDREVHTRDLWLVEGFTAYYDELLLPRAGLMTGERYLELQSEHLRSLLDTPGRLRQSLGDSSWDAWIKFYQRDENTGNTSISYYEKGQLIAMLLDLEIRFLTRSARSLDDVLRVLWERYGRGQRGYEDAALRPLFREATGHDLSSFMDAHVDGVEEPDWQGILGHAGLALAPPKRRKNDPRPARLGVTLEKREGRVDVASVVEGGPAWRGGVSARDELVAIDGRRVTADGIEERLADFAPGDRVRLLVFRDDDQREVEVVLGESDDPPARVVKKKDASSEERALYEAWLGRPWDEKEEDEA